MPLHRHTQVGYPILVSLLATLILIVIAVVGDIPHVAREPLLGLVVAVLLMFSTLTVEVDTYTLRIWFGLGFPRFTWPVREIASARSVRNPWYTGWGIRWAGYWIYNVSGFELSRLPCVTGAGAESVRMSRKLWWRHSAERVSKWSKSAKPSAASLCNASIL